VTKKSINRFRGGIQTNLDPKLDKKVVEEKERQERRIEFINSRYKQAEKDFEQGTETPDVVYTGIQRQDVYSADPLFDKSRESIVDAQSLPVKQYGISPEGDFEVHLDEGSAALEEVKRKTFCIHCGDRQPAMPELWQRAADRLAERIGPPPPGMDFRHGEFCCYCGGKLGIAGAALQRVGFTQLTPDQARLMEEMFGKIDGVTDTDFAKA
jgi:hypothetical protein